MMTAELNYIKTLYGMKSNSNPPQYYYGVSLYILWYQVQNTALCSIISDLTRDYNIWKIGTIQK